MRFFLFERRNWGQRIGSAGQEERWSTQQAEGERLLAKAGGENWKNRMVEV